MGPQTTDPDIILALRLTPHHGFEQLLIEWLEQIAASVRVASASPETSQPQPVAVGHL
jgi:hypothetical protein